MRNEFLYHGHMVQALLRNGRTVEGKAVVDDSEGSAFQSIEIGGTAYRAEEVADIRYLGRLQDYNASSQTGLIDRYSFDGRDCPDSAEFACMVYREQEYRVSCHLEVRRNAIRAVDVKVLEKAHVLNEEILTAERAFYRLADGRWVMGLLESPATEGEGLSILMDGQERIPISGREVADITRIPKVNSIVTARIAGGESVHGIVSAVEENRMLIIADMLPKRVYYRDLEELRYQGTVTEWRRIDGKYYYSAPSYLKDREEEKFICEKAAVSYVAGVSGKGWIAKDIKLVERAGEAPQDSPLDQYGIILMININKTTHKPSDSDIGYIGPEYRSEACGFKNGNVRFQRGQLTFWYDYTTGIYVVRYSLEDAMSPDKKYFQVRRMELVEVVDYARYGIVRVDGEGRIEKVPIYRALPRHYEDRKADVLCRGGVSSGIIIDYKEEGILLEKAEGGGGEMIPYDEIETVRIRGRITGYNGMNAPVGKGTGYIDNNIWFHINDVDGLARAMIRKGALVSYEISNSIKGKDKLSGKNISVVGERRDVYVLSCRDGVLTVAETEEYEKNPLIASRYSIDTEDCASFPDLDRYDYRAVFALRKNGDRWKGVLDQVVKSVPKEVKGYITELKGNTVRIVPSEQYGEGEEGECFTLANEQKLQGMLPDLKRYDIAVRYRYWGQDFVEVVSVDGSMDKLFYGYLHTYKNDKQYGFITPKEYYGRMTVKERREKGVDVFCTRSVFKNAPKPIDTLQYNYYVKYTLDYKNPDPQKPAGLVFILKRSVKSGVVIKEEQEAVSRDVPGLREGETFFCRSESGEFCRAEFAYEKEGRLYGKDGQALDTDADTEAGGGEIWRLGVLTGFDAAFQEGYLNGRVCFDFSVMESKTFNIAKAGKKCLLLAYRTEKGQVSYIEKLSQEMLGQIPWIQGTVTNVLEEENGRVILIGGETRHYISVLTDGLVSRLAKNDSLTGESIYLRQVACPVWSGQDGAEMMAVAAEVHCEREEAAIRYDVVLDRYTAKRDQVSYPAVKGSISAMRELVGTSALLGFKPDETGLQLEAYLEQGADYAQEEPEPEDEELEQSAEIIGPALGGHCLEQGDLHERIEKIIGNPNFIFGEPAYYITLLLRENQSRENRFRYLYQLFSQDYLMRMEIQEEMQASRRYDAEKCLEKLQDLFGRECAQERVRDIVAHILPLDKQSAEFLFSLQAIQRNVRLSQEILKFAIKIDGTMRFENVGECLNELRKIYQQDRRRYSREMREIDLRREGGDVCGQCAGILRNMLARFCQLMCQDDRDRFQKFSECCDRAERSHTAGFDELERNLRNAYRDIDELEKEVEEHPTQQAAEILKECGVFRKIKEEIFGRLDQLYRDEKSRPDIRCYSNESEVLREQKSILLLVENGGEGGMNRQTARNLTFTFGTVTEGIVITDERVRLSGRDLQSGTGSQMLEIHIDLTDLEEDSFSIDWSAEYEYATGFDGTRPLMQSTEKKGAEPINFQLLQGEIWIDDKRGVANPYKESVAGALKTHEMFFGRKTEFQEIWDCIVSPEKELIPGRTVIVYGQKKCGKTSLIYQVTNRLKEEEEIRSQAIIIDIDNILERCGGPDCLSNFTLNFYYHILAFFADEIGYTNPDVEELMEREGLEVPDLGAEAVAAVAPALFQRFFARFRKLDQGRHKILLVMDEFTLLCTTILQKLPEHPEYQHIPDFIKMLSGMGFIQIIIGHEAMMRALSQLGVINHTAEFAKKIEISALKREDGRDLIRKPMEQCFKRDIYWTPLGKRAVEKLLDLSGCSPYFLMKLCDRMFRYFVANDKKSQLIDVDVDAMVKAYVKDLETNDFDILLLEDGDGVVLDEDRPTYLYLKQLIRESIPSNNHDCDFNMVCEELGEVKSNETRKILLDRRILSMGNGRIRLNMWLFAEFMKFKYGM